MHNVMLLYCSKLGGVLLDFSDLLTKDAALQQLATLPVHARALLCILTVSALTNV